MLTDAWFPALRVRISVFLSNSVRITFIRKNSVYIAYVKITFSVAVSFPFPFIRSKRIEFYFSVSVRYTARKRQRRYTERQRGHDYVNGYGWTVRNAGNQAWPRQRWRYMFRELLLFQCVDFPSSARCQFDVSSEASHRQRWSSAAIVSSLLVAAIHSFIGHFR